MAARQSYVTPEYLLRLTEGLGGRLTEIDKRRFSELFQRPEFRAAAVFDLERRFRDAHGVDPRDAVFVNPLPEALPQGDISIARLVRGDGSGARVAIPGPAASPAICICGKNLTGKSWAAYAMADGYVDHGCAAICFDFLDGGWTRTAARRGPGRARVIDGRSWLCNPLQSESGETLADAVGRLKQCLRPLWIGPNMSNALERIVDDVAADLAISGGGTPCLEDVWQRLESVPARGFRKSAEARESLRDRLQSPRAQLPNLFAVRTGMPVCRLLDPILTVFHLPGLAMENVALFARVIDVMLEAHIRAHPVHAPRCPGWPAVIEVLEESPAHVPSVGMPIPEGGDFHARRTLTCRHYGISKMFISQLGDLPPEVLQAVGCFVAFPLPTARSRWLIGDRLGLDGEARDYLLSESRPPREGVMKFTGSPGALHVRFDDQPALPSDESVVRAATDAELAQWRKDCTLWTPRGGPSIDLDAARVARVREEATRHRTDDGPEIDDTAATRDADDTPRKPPLPRELSALSGMTRDRAKGLLEHLADVAAHPRLHAERPDALRISVDEESRRRKQAIQLGLERIDETIGNRLQLAVITPRGLEVLRAAGWRGREADSRKGSMTHEFLIQRTTRAFEDETPGARVLRSGTALTAPDGASIEPDAVVVLPGSEPDRQPRAIYVQVALSNQVREIDAASRLAQFQEVAVVLLVARNARYAQAFTRKARALFRDRAEILGKLRIVDAGAVLERRIRLTGVVVGGLDERFDGGAAPAPEPPPAAAREQPGLFDSQPSTDAGDGDEADRP